MPRRPVGAKADYHASVLDGLIRVIQLSAHSTHILTLCVHKQLLQPVYGYDLRIVIQKQNVISRGRAHSKIIHGRVIKGPFEGYNFYGRIVL